MRGEVNYGPDTIVLAETAYPGKHLMYCVSTYNCRRAAGPAGYAQTVVDGMLDSKWESIAVCAGCFRPSKLVFERMTGMRVPFGSKCILNSRQMLNGVTLLRWAMEDGTRKETMEFHTYPRKVDMNNGESLLFRTWELLDSKVEVIMAEPNGPSDNELEAAARERAKNEARGIAETLAILMQPFLTNADDVVRHAVKRYKAKQAGETYEVPGLSEHIWDPTKNWDGSDRVELAEPKKKSAIKAPAKPVVDNKSTRKLKPEEIEGIRSAVESGMFSEEDVASMFKVSMAEVRSALN